jgi:hypothetical protein
MIYAVVNLDYEAEFSMAFLDQNDVLRVEDSYFLVLNHPTLYS